MKSLSQLKNAVIQSLSEQGYRIQNNMICLPDNLTKADYRAMNKLAVQRNIEKSAPAVRPHENRLIRYIADGKEVCPESICPKIVSVKSNSEHELLFRYACLHWSIPVSSGYGRRLRLFFCAACFAVI